MEEENKTKFLENNISRSLLAQNAILAIAYFLILIFLFKRGNMVLFYMLMAGEVFHLWQVLTYIYTIWDTNYAPMRDSSYLPAVDVFITVAGEPIRVIEETVCAALAMRYPFFNVYILNDGYILNKDKWRDVEILAKRIGVSCITRKKIGGAKAGNINNALRETSGELFAIFDSDHIPHEDFLKKTIPYFADEKVAFVQSPQYYRNWDKNYITAASWEQQSLFFGVILKGKNRLNAVSLCGTNMVLRRSAINEVGGMYEKSIAEDFITGLMMHKNGWKSVYHPEVLAEGLAPEDLKSYYTQQFRWARGSFDTLFAGNLIFTRKLTLAQKIQYLSSVSFFFSGLVIAMNAALPLVYFFTGLTPLTISTMWLAAVFLPYIFMTVYTLKKSSNFNFTFRSLAVSMSSFPIHLQAVLAAILRKKSAFVVTSKESLSGNFIWLAAPHMLYFFAVIFGIFVAISREGASPSLINNIAWALIYVVIFKEWFLASLPEGAFAKKKVFVPRDFRTPVRI